MRSQVIKVRNLPECTVQPYTIHVKPVAALAITGIAGFALLITGTAAAGAGVILILVSVFSLLMMPDRRLIQFTPDYMVLYNHRDASVCTIIYWDELVTWQYNYHPAMDVLIVSLTDGSSQSIELFSKRTAARFLNMYAPGKEIKNVRRKDEASK